MLAPLIVLHLMVCLVLIAVVLLQRGKGADIGAALGGGASNTVFGGRGAGNFLTKLTTVCAVTFMLSSLALSYLGAESARDSIVDEEFLEETNAPAESSGLEDVGDAADSGLEEIPAAGQSAEAGSGLEEIPAPAPEGAAPAEPAAGAAAPSAADPEAPPSP